LSPITAPPLAGYPEGLFPCHQRRKQLCLESGEGKGKEVSLSSVRKEQSKKGRKAEVSCYSAVLVQEAQRQTE